MNHQTVIVLVGPTAVGKTAVAMQLAHHFKTSIISADSRQCYRELNIGVAKPSPTELQSVRHYFINSHSIHENMHAGLFEGLALTWADEIFLARENAIMVGGTGLYIKAFCEGLDDIPLVNHEIRSKIRARYLQSGMDWLQNEVRQTDPAYYATGEITNPQRLMRALEVKLSTQRSILSYRTQVKRNRPFKMIKAGLRLPKEELIRNIGNRTDKMMSDGLLDEVRALLPNRYLNGLQTVGFTELFEYLDGKISLRQAVEQIKRNTWQYARRQMTWFRKDPDIYWTDPGNWTELKKITES